MMATRNSSEFSHSIKARNKPLARSESHYSQDPSEFGQVLPIPSLKRNGRTQALLRLQEHKANEKSKEGSPQNTSRISRGTTYYYKPADTPKVKALSPYLQYGFWHASYRGLIKATSNRNSLGVKHSVNLNSTNETFNFRVTSTIAATPTNSIRSQQHSHPQLSNQYLSTAAKLISSLDNKITHAIHSSSTTKKSMYSIHSHAKLPALSTLPPIKDPPKPDHSAIIPSSTRSKLFPKEYSAGTLIKECNKKPAPILINKMTEVQQVETPHIKVKSYASKSVTGKSPSKPNKQNQDSYFTIKDFNGMKEAYLFGVLDGHGTNGHFVSDYVKKRFLMNLEVAELKSLQMKTAYRNKSLASLRSQKGALLSKDANSRQEILVEACKRTNSDLHMSVIDVTFSGTTLVTVLLIGDLAVCANVGDSRAIIGTKTRTEEWKARAISRDHKPDLPEEHDRIIKSNGRIASYMDDKGNPLGPKRVWKKDVDLPGLAMSRALGDKSAAEAGVICIPEVLEEKLDEEDKVLVIASDGVWEHLDNEKVVEIVGEYWEEGDAQEACEILVRKARDEWIDKAGDVVDDVTATVVFFN